MSIVYQNDFSSTFTGCSALHAINTPIFNPTGAIGIANRVEIKNGVLRTYLSDADPETFGGQRSEVLTVYSATGDDIWYDFEVFIKATEWVQLSFEEISVFQVHASDSISGVTVDFMCVLTYGALQFYLPVPEPPSTPITSTILGPVIEYPFDKWNRFCLHMNYKNTSTGLAEVFMNSTRLWSVSNRGTAYTSDTPYLKLGQYNTQHTAGFGSRAATYRNLTVYSGIQSYQTVLGTVPKILGPLVR